MKISIDRGIERMTTDAIALVEPVITLSDKEEIKLSGRSVPSEVRKLFRKVFKGPHPDIDLSQLEIPPLLPEEYLGTLEEIEDRWRRWLKEEEDLEEDDRKNLSRGIQVMQRVRGNQKIIRILRGLLLKS